MCVPHPIAAEKQTSRYVGEVATFRLEHHLVKAIELIAKPIDGVSR